MLTYGVKIIKAMKVIATYENGMQKNDPAIMEAKVGKGKLVMLGTDPGQKAIKELIMKYASQQKIEPVAKGDPGTLVVPRNGKKGKSLVVVNYSGKSTKLNLGNTGMDIIADKEVNKDVNVAPYDVMIIDLDK